MKENRNLLAGWLPAAAIQNGTRHPADAGRKPNVWHRRVNGRCFLHRCGKGVRVEGAMDGGAGRRFFALQPNGGRDES